MLWPPQIIIAISSAFTTTVLAAPNEEPWDAYVWVDNADSLFREYTDKGVRIAPELATQPYLMRDCDVEDCNGYRLC